MYKLVFLLVFSVKVLAALGMEFEDINKSTKDINTFLRHERRESGTPTSDVFLEIKQLNNADFKTRNQVVKIYNVSFTHEETIHTYDCVLSNPTDKEETYTISYYVNGSKKAKTQGNVTLQPHSSESLIYTFRLKKADQTIKCSAVHLGRRKDAPNPRIEINLHYVQQVTFIGNNFDLKKDNKNITCDTCVALDVTQHPLTTNTTLVAQLQNSPPENDVSSSTVHLIITGLPDNSCKIDTGSNIIEKLYNYTFGPELIGTTKKIDCTLTGNVDYIYNITFEGEEKTAPANHNTTLSKEITLKENNDPIKCKAKRTVNGGFVFYNVVKFYYIPPPVPTSTEQATTVTEKPTTIQVPTGLESKRIASVAGNESPWWLKFVLGGGATFIFICVVVCIIVYYHKKKPPPDDLTYANLAKDQKNYATLPMPAPRTLQKDAKPKVTFEGTYSEPKDSQDMSEALYADPNRFNGSETYAEPYVKSGSKPCTYAEPNKPDYAEPYMPKEGSCAAIGASEGGYATVGNKSEGNYAAIGNSEGNYAAIGKSEGGYATVEDQSEGNYAAIGNSEGNYAAIGKSEGGYATIGYKSEGNYAAIGNSEPNYAAIGAKSEGINTEIGVNNNDSKELYAKPIPKAQRPFKAKDESDYSNVFKELYANAKKK